MYTTINNMVLHLKLNIYPCKGHYEAHNGYNMFLEEIITLLLLLSFAHNSNSAMNKFL